MSTLVDAKKSIAVRIPWVQYLLAGGLIFLALFFTRAAEQTRDSLVYAYSARTGVELFHPHHLLYTPVIRLFLQAIQAVCPGCDAVFAGQVHNILWSVVGILAFFSILRGLWGPPVALAAALFFTGLRGYWELSTQTTMYVPSAAILALLSAVLIGSDPRRDTPLRPGKVALLAGLLALSVLYHQSNVLFVLPLGVYLIAAQGKAGARAWLTISLLAGLVTFTGYVLVYLLTTGGWSLTGFIQYCLSYTSEICLGGTCKTSPDGWGSLGNLSPGGLNQLLSSLFWNVIVLPERLEALILPGFGLALLALTGWHVAQILRRAADWVLRLFLLAWFYAYTLFFFWWLPSYQHPFAAGLIPLTLLGMLALRDVTARQPVRRLAPNQTRVERITAAAVVLAALIVAGRNFQARILPLNRSAGEAYHEAAELYAAAGASASAGASAPAGCVFLTSYHTWNHLRYYFDSSAAVQIRHPLSFFLQGAPLPAEFQIADRPCVYAAVNFLLPTYVDEDYSESPVSAYQAPDRWLAYLTWLLDIRQSTGGNSVTSRDFALVRVGDGTSYLRLLPARRAARDMDDLFHQLDTELQAADQPFESWFSQVQ